MNDMELIKKQREIVVDSLLHGTESDTLFHCVKLKEFLNVAYIKGSISYEDLEAHHVFADTAIRVLLPKDPE